MLETLGERQQQLLLLLLNNKAGLTVDALSAQLQITRNAVRQHLAALERDGLVTRGDTKPSGGRPEQLYLLSDRGGELFPRRYSWFSEQLIEAMSAIVQICGPTGGSTSSGGNCRTKNQAGWRRRTVSRQRM